MCIRLSLTVIFVLAAWPATAGDPCGPGHMRDAKVRSGALELQWEGQIGDQMSGDIAAEFDRHKRLVPTVSLSLHSCGGSVLHMQRVIAVLEQIKATHQVVTKVDRGRMCGSACVPIFLTGGRRVGALTSSFYFHPVVISRRGVDPGTRAVEAFIQSRSEATDKILSRYFIPARLSDDWLQYLRRTLRTHDLWQSGRDLWESKSGVLTETLDNLQPREDGPIDLPPEVACGLLCRG
jgi:hypothetical protein